jgi:hypothetical protein
MIPISNNAPHYLTLSNGRFLFQFQLRSPHQRLRLQHLTHLTDNTTDLKKARP